VKTAVIWAKILFDNENIFCKIAREKKGHLGSRNKYCRGVCKKCPMGVKIQIFRMMDLKFRRGGPDVTRGWVVGPWVLRYPWGS